MLQATQGKETSALGNEYELLIVTLCLHYTTITLSLSLHSLTHYIFYFLCSTMGLEPAWPSFS